MAQPSSYNVLFLPGLPGEKKRYDILNDIERSGGNVTWVTYSGTYDNKDSGDFSLSSCVADVEKDLDRMEKDDKPYIVIAYSFSSVIVRMIEFSRFRKCSGILIYSPITNLRYGCKGGDFESLLDNLQNDHSIGRVGSWDGQIPPFDQWLIEMNDYFIPTIMFTGALDETKPSQAEIDTIKENIIGRAPFVRIVEVPTAYHKINSYTSTVAAWYTWGLVTKILLDQALQKNHSYYLWGSILDEIAWTKHSDIDILIIGNVGMSDYQTIATTAKHAEDVSGIHVGVSINTPSDLDRDLYIRRNRGAVFLRELKTRAMPLGEPSDIRSVSDNEVALDALNTNRILRSEVSKQLLRYYRDKSTSKCIIKSYIQVVRLSQYARCNNAPYETIFTDETDTGRLFKKCLEAKYSNYEDVPFEFLYDLYVSIDAIVRQQEKVT